MEGDDSPVQGGAHGSKEPPATQSGGKRDPQMKGTTSAGVAIPHNRGGQSSAHDSKESEAAQRCDKRVPQMKGTNRG